MVNSIEELARLIAKRDNVSINEALGAIHDCQNELQEMPAETTNYVAAVEIIYDYLGLEPDYLMLLLGY